MPVKANNCEILLHRGNAILMEISPNTSNLSTSRFSGVGLFTIALIFGLLKHTLANISSWSTVFKIKRISVTKVNKSSNPQDS
jgi:hypothetical protein